MRDDTFQLMRRFRSGISANASYTYSKAIDNAVQAQNFLDSLGLQLRWRAALDVPAGLAVARELRQ